MTGPTEALRWLDGKLTAAVRPSGIELPTDKKHKPIPSPTEKKEARSREQQQKKNPFQFHYPSGENADEKECGAFFFCVRRTKFAYSSVRLSRETTHSTLWTGLFHSVGDGGVAGTFFRCDSVKKDF